MPDEKECFTCGSKVPDPNPRKGASEHFQTVIKALFVFSGVLTVASLFTDLVPSFGKCFAALVVLFLVKNSAESMAESKKT